MENIDDMEDVDQEIETEKKDRDWVQLLGMDLNSRKGNLYRESLKGYGVKFTLKNPGKKNQKTEISDDEKKTLRKNLIKMGVLLARGKIQIVKKK